MIIKKSLLFVFLFAFLSQILSILSFGQSKFSIPQLSKILSPKLVLQNALYPVACLDYQGNIICSGVYWISSYPLVTQKVDSLGNLLWPNVPYGIPVSHPVKEGDETSRQPYILPKNDGGAFFTYEYMDYMGRQDHAKLYHIRPMLQSISPTGEILWGNNGIDLTNRTVRKHGGADMLGLRYDTDGNIIILWSWLDVDSTSQPNIYGTYLQKVNPNTGELILDSTGVKLTDEWAWYALISDCGNTYLVYRPWILCLDQSGEKVWELELMAGLTAHDLRIRLATNNDGDILILYSSIDGIRGRLFTKNGDPIWQDKLIVSGEVNIFPSSPLIHWGNNKWLLARKKLYCFDRQGEHLWNEEGIIIPDSIFETIKDVVVDKNNTVLLIYSTHRNAPMDPINLKLQKLDQNGEFIWGNDGIFIMDNIGTSIQLLPDSRGGAYIVIEGGAIYEPEFRPRGTFIEKVDQNGNLGFITNNVEKNAVNHIPMNFNFINYPNPFHNHATISINCNFNGRENSFLIIIYNLIGEEVRRFQIRNHYTNVIQVKWDGKDQFGSDVAEGIYFCRITKKNKWIAAGKLTFLKDYSQ